MPSEPLPSPAPPAAGPSAGSATGRAAAVGFVAALGLLLAAFPTWNVDLWGHLANGRDLAFSPTWLYDLGTFGIFSAAGGVGLAAAKALAVGGMAAVLLLAARTGRGWTLPVVCVALAVLAMGTRFLLQPATASLVLLALTVWLLREDQERPRGVWPDRWLLVVFLIWANVDRGFLFGLGAVALVWLGRALDGRGPKPAARLVAFAVLAGVCLLNPAHARAYAPLTEVVPTVREALGVSPADRPPVAASPLQQAYWSAVRRFPAALAAHALLGLGLVSFAAVGRGGWRWDRFLPWAGLGAAAVVGAVAAFRLPAVPSAAVVAAVQAPAVALFAVVAGPITAWNLQDDFARRGTPLRGNRAAGAVFGGLAAVAFLVAAWPGWLQRLPYEPPVRRQLAVVEPEGLKRAAERVGRWQAEGLWPAGTRTLHVPADGRSATAAAFAWYAPGDPRAVDAGLAEHLVTVEDPAGRLREAGVNRVVVWAADRGLPERVLFRLLADPEQWPLLNVDGGVAVFGWRDPAAATDPYRGREVDLDRLGFRPSGAERAPDGRPERGERTWSDVFRRPAPPRTPDRDEAALLLRKAEAVRRTGRVRKLVAWEVAEAAGLVGAAGGWVGANGLADAAARLAVLRPPVDAGGEGEMPPVATVGLALRERFELIRDDIPPGVLYAAVRAGRRAVAANPQDAAAHLSLGEAYLGLLVQTRERVWATGLPQLARLRELQALTAFARAAALNPDLALAHRELGRLYQVPTFACTDLALDHLRAYRDLVGRRLPAEAREPLDREVAKLAETVERQTREWEAETARSAVTNRAEAAARRGLGKRARDLLLESDVSAFGPQGMALELDLMLRTGRADEVLDWAEPEVLPALGETNYHWVRAQGFMAAGEYGAANLELADLAELEGGMPDPATVGELAKQFVARELLNSQPGGFGVAAVTTRAVSRAAFESQLGGVTQRLAQQADTATLRGMVALEAGDVGAARAAFRSALQFSTGRTGGLAFAARPTARDALAWLDGGP